MSKTVKSLLIRDYQQRLSGVSEALVISIRGVNAIDNNKIRVDLAKKRIKITVVRNNLATHAFKQTPLAVLEGLLDGPSALAYGAESVVDVARALVDWGKKVEKLELRGALLDGVLYEGKKAVEELSKFPTKSEAQAQVVTLVLSPARNLMGQVRSPGAGVMGLVKAIEQKLEKGEAIAKVG